MGEAKRQGRPRKYADEKAKMRSWRQKQEGRRLDGYIDSSASWRIERLSKEWDCSLSKAVERLVMEADEKYSGILFPEPQKPEKTALSQDSKNSWASKLRWKCK